MPPESRSSSGLGERRRPIDVLAWVGVSLATFVITTLASPRGATVTFQLGPNDSPYLAGFDPFYETADDVATRWTTYDAEIDLPLSIEGGPVDLTYRFSRQFAETAVVEVLLAGQVVDQFTCRGGEVLTRTARLAAVERRPLTIHFHVDSHERRNQGLRLDWVQVATGPRGLLSLRGWALWLPAIFSAFLFIAFRWGGLSQTVAFFLVLPWMVVVAVWVHLDPFGLAHIVLRITLSGILLTAAATAFLRSYPCGRWVVPLFVAGFLLKGMGLFHPTTFYPDVANARRYVMAIRGTSGTLAERGIEAQIAIRVGYPRRVAGKDYALPYSPLYFMPFGLLAEPGDIENAVRHVGLATACLELLPVFWLASTIFGPRTGLAASLLCIFLPPAYSRLLLAVHSTFVGHFLDCLAMAAVARLAYRPESRRRLAAVAAATLASFLVYVSSLFTLTTFLVAMAALDRRLALRLLAILAGAGAITVAWLYWPFALVFLTEIVPALLRGPSTGVGGVGLDTLWSAIRRIPLFYGIGYPALAVVGLVLARRRVDRRAFRLLVAYALAFLGLVGLRAFGGNLFKDLKEIMFVGPLMAILTAYSLESLQSWGRLGRVIAALLTAGLLLFGMARYRGYLKTYASPVMSLDAWVR